ncbi:MAG: MBL fold metallo-hydrolase [Clostridia bacterium]|nr:MBL fold metallo-hydrolase [Clostridia bacterium]
MAKVCPLFSSSKGNSTYIGAQGGGILVDVGVSAKKLVSALNEKGVDIDSIKGVFITHSHTDHISGLQTLTKHHNIPIFASEKTFAELIRCNRLPAGATINIENCTTAADMEISRFFTSHDSPGSCGYTVTLPNGEKVAVCTDLGYVSDEVRNAITGCKTVVLESNHDISMLNSGPYPIELKMRISSKLGHLSNTACASELSALLKSGTTRFILAHLSEENNRPEIAKTAAVGALISNGFIENEDYLLTVAAPCGNKIISI